MTSISRKASKYQTVDDIMSGSCEGCGGPLGIDTAHVGGYVEYQPFVVYDYHSPKCPRRFDYYVQRIPMRLALEVDELIHWTEVAFGLQQEEEEAV